MGVAVSGALSRAADAERQTVRFVESLRAGVRGRKIGPEKKADNNESSFNLEE